jgi:deazaflavin-dependent oxidoreductase (nitroreductase family)
MPLAQRPQPEVDETALAGYVLARIDPEFGRSLGGQLRAAVSVIEVPMDDSIRRALSESGVIDITTTGRRTGQPRRIEIAYHVIGGRIYISGMPRADRTRSWLVNLEANPRFTFHLKHGVTADLPATAREVLEQIARVWNRTDFDFMVAYSPLVEVTIEGPSGTP